MIVEEPEESGAAKPVQVLAREAVAEEVDSVAGLAFADSVEPG